MAYRNQAYLSTDPDYGTPIPPPPPGFRVVGQGAPPMGLAAMMRQARGESGPPQRIQLPDGSIGEFPAGMPDSEIEAVLQREYPPTAQAPRYTVKDNHSGRTVTFAWHGEQPPTDADLAEVFTSANVPPPPPGYRAVSGGGSPILTPEEFARRYGSAPPGPAVLTEQEFAQRYGGQYLSTDPNAGAPDYEATTEPESLAQAYRTGLGGLIKSGYNTLAGASRAPLGPVGLGLLGPLGAILGAAGVPRPEPVSVAPDEQTAYQIGNAAQYFLPGSVAGKGTGLLAMIRRAAIEGAGTAGLAKAQGDDNETAALAGALGAAAPVAGATGEALSGVGRRLGSRVLNSLIKPTNADFAFGKNPGRGVLLEKIKANSLKKLTEKISAKAEELGQLVDRRLAPVKERLDITPALAPIDDAIKAAVADGERALLGRLRHLRDQITHEFTEAEGKLVKGAAKPMEVTPLEANAVKRKVARLSKWREGDRYADDVDKLGKTVSRNIAGLIESKVPGVAALNRRWADMIAAESAAVRRAKNEARRDLSGLTALLSGGATTVASALGSGGFDPGDVLLGATIGGGAKLLGTPAVKTRIAQGLAHAGDPLATLYRVLRAAGLGAASPEPQPR